MNAYQKGTRYICIHETEYPCILEKRIIARFNEVFELTCGNEYFRGDEMQMYDEFEALCRDMKCNPPISHDEDNCGGSASENADGNIDISNNEIDESITSNVQIKQKKMKSKTSRQHICAYCLKDFKRADALKRHMNRSTPCHESHPNFCEIQKCPYCDKLFDDTKSKQYIIRHKSYCKKRHNGILFQVRQQEMIRKHQLSELKRLREQVEAFIASNTKPMNNTT